MVWVAWIALRNGHLRKREAVEDGSIVVVNIVDDNTLSIIDYEDEVPFLPFDRVAFYLERGTFRLRDVYGLEMISDRRFHQVGDPFVQSKVTNWILTVQGIPIQIADSPCRCLDDPHDLSSDSVDDRADRKGEGVMI